jgi:release factor glutamine methyltransferase
MSGTPYLFSEDSALLKKALVRHRGEKCLEIGTGNGGVLSDLSKRFAVATGTDLARPAAMPRRDNETFVLADEASCFRDSSFDLVAFNPPYLAEAGTGDAATDGGLPLQAPMAFLQEALRAVKRSGTVVFLLNDQANVKEMEDACARKGFGLRRVSSARVFFEELTIYEASPRNKGGLPSGAAHPDGSTDRRPHQVPASTS